MKEPEASMQRRMQLREDSLNASTKEASLQFTIELDNFKDMGKAIKHYGTYGTDMQNKRGGHAHK